MNHQNGPNPPPYLYPPPYPPYGYPPYMPQNPWRKPIRRNANIVCFGLLLMILLGMFLPSVFYGVGDYFIYSLGIESTEAFSVIDLSCDLIVSVLMLLVPVIIMQLWIGIPLQVAFPMRRPRKSVAIPGIFICLGVSVIGLTLTSFIAAFFQEVFGLTPEMQGFPDPTGVPSSVLYFLRLALIPAIFEELMFRGVIMQSLRRFGDSFALVCSSILFSLAHRNLIQGPNTLLIGLAIGFFVLRTGSLRTGIMIHFVNNSLAVVMDFASRNLPYRELSIFNIFVLAGYLIIGLIGIAILLLNHSGTLSLAPSGYPMPEGGKYSAFFLTAMPIIYIITVLIFISMLFSTY